MKAITQLLGVVLFYALASTATAGLITSTVGDADCFGLGGACAAGDEWRDDLGGAFFTDYRSPGDNATAPHTDIWNSPTSPSWTHSYSLGGGSATSAFFDLFIAGFADIGAVNLLADATIIATYDFPGLFQRVHKLTAAVPLGLLDGSTVFTLTSSGNDGFIIDQSVLRIETTDSSVPTPATLALFGLGLIGLRVARRKRQHHR